MSLGSNLRSLAKGKYLGANVGYSVVGVLQRVYLDAAFVVDGQLLSVPQFALLFLNFTPERDLSSFDWTYCDQHSGIFGRSASINEDFVDCQEPCMDFVHGLVVVSRCAGINICPMFKILYKTDIENVHQLLESHVVIALPVVL